MKSRNPSCFWFFNGFMLWGAGLGWLIGASASHLKETTRHKGPGVVVYGDGERGPERSEEVSESQYKRHHYTTGGMMLTFGLALWVAVANAAKNEAAKSESKEDYLEAQIRRASTYHRAFAAVIDDVTRERAAAEAGLSAEFQEARTDEELASRIYYAASKAAKRDAD